MKKYQITLKDSGKLPTEATKTYIGIEAKDTHEAAYKAVLCYQPYVKHKEHTWAIEVLETHFKEPMKFEYVTVDMGEQKLKFWFEAMENERGPC